MFGAKVAFQARISIQKSAETLASFPNMGKVEYITNNNVQIRSLVAKKSKIFYYVDGDTIIIFLIWDTRGNPETLRELINMI